MKIEVEASASLKIWPITVTIAGVQYQIPPTPANVWMQVLGDGGWLDIIPGLLPPDDRSRVVDDALAGAGGYAELVAAAQDAVTAAAGRPWWVAATLVGAAYQQWSIIGPRLIGSGINLEQISLAAACDAIYHVATQGMNKDQLGRFDRQLLTPPPAAVRAPVRRDRAQAVTQFRRQLADDAAR